MFNFLISFQTRIVHRDAKYFVIIRKRICRIPSGGWHELPPRYLSKAGAIRLSQNVKPYLLGKFDPQSNIN